MDAIAESDPRYKWTRNTNAFGSGPRQVTAPEETWRLLEMLNAEMYPDGMGQRLLIRIKPKGAKIHGLQRHYDTTIAYEHADSLAVWSVALESLLELLVQDMGKEWP